MASIDLGTVACVTVTYHPDPAVLHSQLRALPAESIKVLVDNGSPKPLLSILGALLADIANLEMISLDENVGLAAATNIGARHVSGLGKSRLLLILDQDSEPCTNSIASLAQAFDSLSEAGVPVGAVGPALVDPATGRRHGFHIVDGLRWSRVDPDEGPPVRCDSLNGSGTLTDLVLFHRLGGLEEALFIDHVDTEWSFRMSASGRHLYGVPAARFIHRMGDSSMRVWLGGWRVWPIRSPRRHRYLFRNALRLWRRPYVPWIWKAWMLPKLLITALVYALTGPSRWSQLKAMCQGVADGMRGIGGRI